MARTGPRTSRCPDCNAPFKLQAGQTHYTCGYCGIAFDLEGTPERARLPPPTSPPGKPASSGLALGIGVVLMLTAGVLVAQFLIADPAPQKYRPPVTASPPVLPSAPPVALPPPAPPAPAPAGGNFQWDAQSAPAFMDVNGDGTDDVIGHIRRFANSKPEEWVAAFDGKTLAMLWETPPVEGPDAATTTKVIAQGGKLVMSGPRTVTLLEAATGKSLGSVPLSDAPRRLCRPPGDTESVWVEVVDHQHLMLDTRTGTARPARKAPPRCATPPLSPQTCEMGRPPELATSCVRSAYPPSDIRGFSSQFIFRRDDFLVVTGTRWPGTTVPLVAVFEKGNRKPLWHGNVADMDPTHLRDTAPRIVELDGDAVFIAYELEQPGGFHLIRRDARTGAVRWDVPIPRSKEASGPNSIWTHDGRVYVPHWSWLDVFEAETGHLVGTLGRW